MSDERPPQPVSGPLKLSLRGMLETSDGTCLTGHDADGWLPNAPPGYILKHAGLRPVRAKGEEVCRQVAVEIEYQQVGGRPADGPCSRVTAPPERFPGGVDVGT